MTDYDSLWETLKAKAISPSPCPVCAENHWSFPNYRFGLLPLDPISPEDASGDADEDDGGGLWPVTCLNCGHVRLFDIETLRGQ